MVIMMQNTETGNELVAPPIIARDDVTATRKLEPIYDSKQSFYGKATLDTDKYGGQILKSYDTPILAIYMGMPFAVENSYEPGKQGIKILDTPPDVGKYSQTTARHTKEFLSQFTDIGTNLSTKDWNKAIAARTAERFMDVYGIRKNEQGYQLSVAIDDRYGENLTFPIEPKYIIPSSITAAIVLRQALEHLHQHANPYNQVLAQQYEQNVDYVFQEFTDRFVRYVNRAMENDPEIKAVVEQNQQRMQAQEKQSSLYQQKVLDKINREANHSQEKDKTQDMDR